MGINEVQEWKTTLWVGLAAWASKSEAMVGIGMGRLRLSPGFSVNGGESDRKPAVTVVIW
jgi:hypothetical protein